MSYCKFQYYLIFTETLMLLQVNFQIFLWIWSYFYQLYGSLKSNRMLHYNQATWLSGFDT